MPDQPIKRIREVLAYENPWIACYFDQVQFPDGSKGSYTRITGKADIPGVVIIPLDNKKNIGLVRIFRYPVNKWLWELPRGFGERDISPRANARKELSEETGLTSKKLIRLGSILPDSGLLSTEAFVYLATSVIQGEKKADYENKLISQVRFVTKTEVQNMIKKRHIIDGYTLGAIILAESFGYL